MDKDLDVDLDVVMDMDMDMGMDMDTQALTWTQVYMYQKVQHSEKTCVVGFFEERRFGKKSIQLTKNIRSIRHVPPQRNTDFRILNMECNGIP